VDRDKLIGLLGQLMNGLSVQPDPLEAPGAKAFDAWIELHQGLIGAGPATAQQYETAIREVLA
jgi:hypothetical protein